MSTGSASTSPITWRRTSREPLATQAVLDAGTLPHGQHPYQDRDEVHEIYAEWRQLFNTYTPPRTAVAEAWVDASRRMAYASPAGLGQAFNFDLLKANWDARELHDVITDNLRLAEESGASSTWVLSNHDVVRHPTRYGLPQGTIGRAAGGPRLAAHQRSTSPRSTSSSVPGGRAPRPC